MERIPRLFAHALAALLACALLLAGAAVHAQDNGTQPEGPISVDGDAGTDAAIAQRMRDILEELGGFEDVTVTVRSGVVTLRGETAETADVAELSALAARVDGVVQVRNEVQATSDVVRRLDPALDRLYARLNQMVGALPLFLVALAVFLGILFLGLAIARMRQPWDRLAPNSFISDIYRQIARLVFLIAALVIALDIMGATALLSTILGAAGIIGLAIGFAVRDTVENFIASIMLSFRQPFRPNDVVQIEGQEMGKVIRLTSRATILLSFDGNHIRIPNSTVFKSRMTNFTRNPERRFLFEIGVASDADLDKIRNLATEVVEGLPFTLANPAPLVWIDRIGDGAIFLTVTGWIDQRETSLPRAKGEALRLVKDAIEAAGVEVPDTTYRIQMIQPQAAAPHPAGPPEAEGPPDVTADVEDALDRIIEDERGDEAKPDLLSEDAPEE
ncbi:mechanosensitive ion channel domain-containing protein [Aestuariibius sp. 2305UL40-4]|uniref:mechanosensitive ion channel domain-containing protein n=1 Tax=Aestuariibius violaceus TaxID=3234132 RepID=UPI00398F671C